MRCIMIQAMCFSGTVLNLYWNGEQWAEALPSLQPFIKNPTSLSLHYYSSSTATCQQPPPPELPNETPPLMVYLFCGLFFFVSLTLHFARFLFARSDDEDGPRTGTKSIAGFFGRLKGQTGAFHMSCVHIHLCATTQYLLYYLSATSQTPVLGLPSPWHPDSKVVPLIRYLTWYNTLPIMTQIPLCFANCSTRQITSISACGAGVIVAGWISCGGFPSPTSLINKWAWVSFWFLASELFLIKCCYDLHYLMKGTAGMLKAKSEAVGLSHDALPLTSSLTSISLGITVIWHLFPFVLFIADYSKELFPSRSQELVEAMCYGCIDILAKAFCTYGISTSSFIVEEYLSNLIKIEKQVAIELKLKMEEAFVSFIFHEMRNPFNGMAGHIECANSSFEELGRTLKEGGDAEKMINLMNEIGSDLESLATCKGHMSSILNRALDLVRDYNSTEMMVLDLNKLLTDVHCLTVDRRVSYSLVDNRTAEQKEKVRLGYVMGDSLRLKQVLVNLCSNALNNTANLESDFVRLAIAAEASNIPGYIRLEFSVWDSGSGLSDAMINKVKSSTKFSTRVREGGVGLGLLISQKLVKAMSSGKSSLDVVSPWPPSGEKGSRFSFKLEMEATEGPESGADGETDTPPPPSKRLLPTATAPLPTKIRLLVIDDMLMNRKIITRKLSVLPPFKDLNWVFSTAVNGEEALELLKAEEFDVIWTDEILENTGGVILGSDVVRKVRQEEADRGDRGKVIVISSGNCTDKDRKKFLAAGADFVAVKPTPSADELATLFSDAFRKHGY
ncbi:hypothetical protein TrRE_jg7171 [Triparma retinervis]|uniref:Uncharacterized protein n=1 Tax=Triparma retinervis TaxID=2557542 RepID=A0A9W7A2T5_9STRA|nr:hypothetical protein TrRE_jg7171 [Triparma retinervis]